MILKVVMIYFVLGITVIGVSGASFSKVFVQSGSEVVPFEYVQYSIPSVSLAGSQTAQISADPIGQVIPVPSVPSMVATCAMPCVYPGQVMSAVAPISPTGPNLITYKSSVPVVMPSKEESPGYQYSYVVYDENTGDHKSQYELSDGSVVQGEYSLFQPDGYIREVTYVADDARGFNAIVKHYLPDNVEKKKDFIDKTSQDPPCHEVKNDPSETSEAYKENPIEETHQKLSGVTPNGKQNEKSIQKGSSKENEDKESSKKSDEKDANRENNESKLKEDIEKMLNNEKESGIESNNSLVSGALKKNVKENEAKQSLKDDQKLTEPAELPKSEASLTEYKEDFTSDKNKEEIKDKNTELAILNAKTPPKLGFEGSDILVPYNDIIKCIQAAVNGASKTPAAPRSESPLAYIILNKPC